VTLAKAIGGGLPLGACIVADKYKDVFTIGSHGTTFGGNIVSCRAGLEVIKQLDENRFAYINEIGEYFISELNKLKAKYNFITEVRGKGLMIGMELNLEIETLALDLLKSGFVVNVIHNKILRFLPTYFIEKNDIDNLINCLDKIFSKIS
jgi:acetylornithine/succinyldiaminopimelate/putrescine aminotransferase